MSTLQASGLSGRKALQCCENQRNAYRLRLSNLLGSLLAFALEAETRQEFDQVVALAPSIRPGIAPSPPRIIKVTRGTPLAIGTIILFGATALGSLVAQLATLETMNAVLRAVDVLDQTATSDCERCIRKNVWRQNRKQVKTKTTIRRRQ